MAEKTIPKRIRQALKALILLSFLGITGCYYYAAAPPPPPAPAPYTPPSYDEAWEHALRAAGDAGIQVISADKKAGSILGQRGAADVKIQVVQQENGSIKVELHMKRQQGGGRAIADDFYRAYDRYMGK